MANNSLLTFLAGAAAGAALALYLKSDKEKLCAVVDKVEDFLDRRDKWYDDAPEACGTEAKEAPEACAEDAGEAAEWAEEAEDREE